MTTIHGGAINYGVAMCSDEPTGSGHSSSPDGDIVYFGVEKITPAFVNQNKLKHTYGRTSYSTRTGQKFWTITFTNALINPQAEDTGYAYEWLTMNEINRIIECIEDWTDITHPPVYLMISSMGLDKAEDIALGIGRRLMTFRYSGTTYYYLKGYPMRFSVNLEGGLNAATATLTFEECWV